jgi:hypothetical protein
MAASAALIDPGRQGPHLGHPLADLVAEQHAAAARLRPLADDDFDRLVGPQMRGIEAVARGQYLIDENVRLGAFLLAHAAVAGRRAGADGTGTAAERTLGIGAERTEAHAGDHDRDLQLDRLLGKASAEGHVRRAALAVAFERVTRDRGAEQHQVVEARRRAQGAEPADPIEPLVGGTLDLGDDIGRKGGRVPSRSAYHRQYSAAWSMWKL